MATKPEFDPITVHHLCAVTPPVNGREDDEIHAPLTFLDMLWLYFTPIQRLVFYRIPNISRSQFLENIIPNLKSSLSITLRRFPILAGNLVIFSGPTMPEICYKNGDGVTLICAECNSVDFNSLVHDEERDCASFHQLIPELRPSSDSGEVISSRTPVLALQVTLFPDHGICIGISNNHCVGDARSIFSFMKTWSIISSNLSKDTDTIESQLPIYVFDKNLIKDSKGFARVMFDNWRNFVTKNKQNFVGIASGAEPVNKVRKSFVISAKDVEKLKKSASGENSVRVSTFTVVCSYVWTCLVKSRLLLANNQDQDGDDDDEYFAFTADCRERTDPPIPGNYFGNCLVCCLASAKGSELAEEGGFGKATELLGKSIHSQFLHKDAVFDGFETVLSDVMKLNIDKIVSVAGSPRFNYYELDFGWGKPEKFEFISIIQTGAISLSGCRDCDKGVEVGLALTKPRMDAFTSVFIQGLNA